uniref:Mechanosensitive ion channel n=1 Tax=Desertifilum tharense IPPAS B-1220 TaxID=1781255 RepID=A0ACD5GTA7_9CYAN
MERWIGGAVFWLIMIFVVVAFLERLQLTVVSQPLNRFLDQVLGFLPRLGVAAILLAIAWFLATIVKLVVTRGLRALNLDRRLGQQMGDESVANQNILSDTLASALYWFIFLLFLPSILSTLGLEGTLLPVQALLNDILLILPRLLAAAVIIGAGWLVATVVRRIVTNLLLASGVDRIGSRFGISQASGGQSLSWLAGTIVFVLILIPFGIAALNALQIAAITVPAVAMLTQVLNAVPLIFTAAVVLLIAYVIGRFVAELVTSILAGIGFNNLYYWLGLQSQPYVEPTPPPLRLLLMHRFIQTKPSLLPS